MHNAYSLRVSAVSSEMIATATAALSHRALLGIGSAVAAVLVAFAGAYGYHRDELYFLVAGDHLGWSFPDQCPLTPLICAEIPA
jgi:hypothetical protein